MYTVALNEAGLEHKRRIGSKAMQLARLTGQHIRIPAGFVVTSEALERFLSANRLQPWLHDGDAAERFAAAVMPEEVRGEVAAAFERLQKEQPDFAVAVRSSSSAEDLQEASFAGQYETCLNVTDLPGLLDSIKRCWASLFSSRVQEYARHKHVDMSEGKLPMGVLVQQMVQADVSGVAFSINPVTRREDEIVINASYGLGEAVVSGLVTPDTFFVEKNGGAAQKELGLKEMKIVAAEKRTKEVETSEEEQGRFCMSDDEVAELAEETKKIEAIFGMPVDIEFAVKDGRLYILQARPITA